MNARLGHLGRLGTVTTVLAGRAVPYARGALSAIDKQPLTGAVTVGPLGLAGDEQGDTKFHGGPDKAVHLYATAHYPAWRAELGELPVLQQLGAFGENLAVEGLSEATICLGDRWRIGTVTLEISQGRQPCWKLNDRFGVADMSRRVQDTLRTGWYCRVLEAGQLAAGDDIMLLARPHPDWSIARMMEILYRPCLAAASLQALLALPLVPGWRSLIERRLASGVVEDWEKRLTGP
ncbi:MAG: MOSC domain-containing protein [Sterolibacterium sp.]|nr:MOSC domain-containing protein [Sterolibacterium sp.]